MTESSDIIEALRNNAEQLKVPGDLFMAGGPKDYVGAVPAIRATFFFQNAHTKETREGICQCFDAFAVHTKDHLRWLWREEQPSGPNCQPFDKAKPIRKLMDELREDDVVAFYYTGGEQRDDASDWQFEVFGLRGWQGKMGGWGCSALVIHLPIVYTREHPLALPQLVKDCAGFLQADHGYGGYGIALSVSGIERNEPIEAQLAGMINGFDAGSPIRIADRMADGIKTVSWLTLINSERVAEVGGVSGIRTMLPPDWFALYDYGDGLVIQAGPEPQLAPVAEQPKPASYVLVNELLKPLRVPEIGALHSGSRRGEPRLLGWSAEQWMARFDIDDSELIQYKSALLHEPKLTKETTLLERL